MRFSLSRLATLTAIGVILAAAPGVAITRVGGREGAGRMATRGGLHRLSASDAVAHGHDDTALDVVTAADLAPDSTTSRGAGAPSGPPGAAALVVPPVAASIRLDAPAHTFRRAGVFLRPLGRAPPAR